MADRMHQFQPKSKSLKSERRLPRSVPELSAKRSNWHWGHSGPTGNVESSEFESGLM